VSRELRIEYVPLTKLQRWPRNPKEHDLGAISESVKRWGFVNPIIVNEATGYILAGHGRLDTLQQRKAAGEPVPDGVKPNGQDWLVPVVRGVELPSEEAEAYGVADNKLVELGGWDDQALAEVLSDLAANDALEGVGFDGDDLDALLAELGQGFDVPDDPGAQVDKAAELREKWGTETGQLWRIPSKTADGEHRIVCGDCTDAKVVERVMGGEKATLCVTSPPYGVGKSYETKGVGPWFDIARPAIANMCRFSNVVVYNIGDLYSTGGQFIEPTFSYSISMFSEHGYRPIWIRIWKKPGKNFGVGPYHLVSNKPVQEYEYLAAFGSDATGEVCLDDFEWIIGFANSRFRFVRRLSKEERKRWGYSGVWEMNTVRVNDNHPAMFPLELPERAIKMHSGNGDSVLDVFLGSGTMLVACERLGRLGRGIEISSEYVAVALERLAGMGLEPALVDGLDG